VARIDSLRAGVSGVGNGTGGTPVGEHWFTANNATADRPVRVDTSTANPARVYDYWLGGKDNFAADRKAAHDAIAANPGIIVEARTNRAFLSRVVRELAGPAGYGSSWTSGLGYPARTTRTRSRSGSPRTAGSSTWTTTRRWSHTPGRC
jgi:hypothetical protein